MATIKVIEVDSVGKIDHSIDRVRLYIGQGVTTIYLQCEGLIQGAQAVDVVLTYLDEPQTLHGFYFPNAPQFMDLP